MPTNSREDSDTETMEGTPAGKFTKAAVNMDGNTPTELHIPREYREGRFEGLCGSKTETTVRVKTTTSGWCDDCLKVAIGIVSDLEEDE